jgi:CheY-like chemotaxis protein
MVVADAQRLAQVVTNLVSNGFKYGGGLLHLSVTNSDGRVGLDVTDRGQGLTPPQLEALFQPFERVGAERTGIRGTGLGLALSKLLVESMGGSIGVESDLGTGSTFWIELNAAEPSTAAHPLQGSRPAAAPVDESEEKVILSVEDNPVVLSLLNGIINLRPQMRIVSIQNGSKAFQAVLDNHPDMVLLDLHLPDVDGEEVLRELKKDPRTSAIPVVILSADAISERAQTLLTAGAEAYVTKPIRISTFLGLIDETLAKSAAREKSAAKSSVGSHR